MRISTKFIFVSLVMINIAWAGYSSRDRVKPEFDKVICNENAGGVQGLWVSKDWKANPKSKQVCLFGEGIRSVMRVKSFDPMPKVSDSEFVKENKTPGLADLTPSKTIYCLGQRYQPFVFLFQYPSSDQILIEETKPSASELDPCESVKTNFSDQVKTYVRKK